MAYVANMGDRKGAYRVLVGKPGCKKPLRRHRHKWKNIKIDFKEIGSVH
jgi:hypothetical protein